MPGFLVQGEKTDFYDNLERQSRLFFLTNISTLVFFGTNLIINIVKCVIDKI